MNQGHSPALDQALAAYRSPALYSRLQERALPDDLLLLLRIVAGDAQALEHAHLLSGEAASAVKEAAVMFIQQLMFYPGSDSYRVLGVAASAADSQIKEHYRWLVRWLHPDRNDDEWDAIYADRVTLAWQDLRSPERRREFERRVAEAQSHSPWAPSAPTAPAQRGPATPATPYAPDDFVLSTRTVRRLPMLVLSGVTACAAIVFGLQYYAIQEDAAPAVATRAESPSRPAPAELAVRGQHSVPALPVAAPPLLPDVAPDPVIPVASAVLAPSADLPPAVAVADVQVAPAPKPPAAPPKLAPSKPVALREPPVAKIDPVKSPSPTIAEPVQVVQESVSPAPALINEAIAQDVILRFRSAYASGNINQVRSLLVDDRGVRGSERDAILKNYRKLFESSVSRHMEIRDASWLTESDTAILIASFEAWIQPSGKSAERRINGDIRFDLRSEDGELRIVRVRHVARGG